MTYKTLLFDVDDTLLDFQATEDQALRKLFKDYQLELTPALKASYQALNHALWKKYELGELTQTQVVNTRFADFFLQQGKKVDGIAMERCYRSYLGEGHDLLGNSAQVIAELAKEYELYIVTNGAAKTQHQRLAASGLKGYFKDIFISEEIGCQKPQPEFFQYAFGKIPRFDPRAALIIGDSLTSDILGGVNAGIDTAWMNPASLASGQIQPTYQLRRLEDLFLILAA